MNICIIPARGGSKRIPHKNTKLFCGKPMIAWSIEAAIKSGCFDSVIVSTDDVEIGRIAKHYGAEMPFLRPAELSDDYTGTNEVVAHALRWFLERDIAFERVCCVYATAPFLRCDDLRRGLEILLAEDCDFAFSVTRYAFPIQRALRFTATGRVEMFQPQHFDSRSQDLVEAWHDAGQFYWGQSRAWLENVMIFSPISVPVPLPRYRVQDIDTHEDWAHAEWMWRAMQHEVSGGDEAVELEERGV